MLGHRSRPAPEPDPRDVAPAAAPDGAMLAAVVAQHLDGAVVEDGTARVVSPELTVQCHVDQVVSLGANWQAACWFRVSGGPLGEEPVFTSVPGYGATREQAVAQGGHALTGMMTALLDSLAGREPSPAHPVVRCRFDLDGRPYGLVVTALDRGTPGPDGAVRVDELREALGGRWWLLPALIADDERLPLLHGDDGVLVSLFVGQWPTSRTVELKVHGVDWTTAGVLDAPVERPPGLEAAMLRELAVLVPLGPPAPLTRAAVQRTLDGLAERQAPRQAAGWQGWWVHGGRLGPVLTEVELAAVEAGTGPLPDDVRRFLTQVAGPGAGPGYGLLPMRRVGDAVVLAYAGCGNAWLLMLDGALRGTVWMDAQGSDRTTTQVAASFTEWFTAWLDAAVRDRGPWQQYDTRACAAVGAMSQVLDSLAQSAAAAGEPAPTSLAGKVVDGGFTINGEGAYLPDGVMDPCHGCVAVAANLGLPPTVFASGALTAGMR